jgi:hypothetical protein
VLRNPLHEHISCPKSAPLTYILQSSTNLISGKWVNVTNTPITANGTFQVTVPVSVPADFYRLTLCPVRSGRARYFFHGKRIRGQISSLREPDCGIYFAQYQPVTLLIKKPASFAVKCRMYSMRQVSQFAISSTHDFSAHNGFAWIDRLVVIAVVAILERRSGRNRVKRNRVSDFWCNSQKPVCFTGLYLDANSIGDMSQ